MRHRDGFPEVDTFSNSGAVRILVEGPKTVGILKIYSVLPVIIWGGVVKAFLKLFFGTE